MFSSLNPVIYKMLVKWCVICRARKFQFLLGPHLLKIYARRGCMRVRNGPLGEASEPHTSDLLLFFSLKPNWFNQA